MTARSVITAFVCLGLAAGCGNDEPEPGAPAPLAEDLPAGVAARVGEIDIPTASIQRVARAQGVSLTKARERLVRDALFAARAESALSASELASVERSALARALLEKLDREAREVGEPSAEELQRIVDARWLELDRPAAARTSHAVVVVREPEQKAAARKLAERIASAVEGIDNAESFRKQASEVPAGSLSVRVEQLPPVAGDGRIVPLREISGDPGRLDPVFAAAANAIPEVGGQSPVIETRFGFHVILLEEKLPEKRMPLEERPNRLRDAVVAERARESQTRLLDALKAKTPIQFDRAAEALTARIRVAP